MFWVTSNCFMSFHTLMSRLMIFCFTHLRPVILTDALKIVMCGILMKGECEARGCFHKLVIRNIILMQIQKVIQPINSKLFQAKRFYIFKVLLLQTKDMSLLFFLTLLCLTTLLLTLQVLFRLIYWRWTQKAGLFWGLKTYKSFLFCMFPFVVMAIKPTQIILPTCVSQSANTDGQKSHFKPHYRWKLVSSLALSHVS